MAIALHTLYKGEFCDKAGDTIFIEFKRLHEDGGLPVIPTPIIFSGHNDQPVIISYKYDGDNKINPINGSECTIKIIAEENSTFELSDLYTENERDWQVDIYGAWAWHGWVIPDSCSEPYNSRPFAVTIRATDGLGTLKDIPFLDAGGYRYKGFYPDNYILAEVFKKIGLNMQIFATVNTFEEQMTTLDSPLTQTYIDTARFLDEDNNPFSCEEVLRSVLQRWSARLHQFNNAWQIVNTLELSYGTPVKTWIFDNLGIPNGTTFIGNINTAGGKDKSLIPVDATNSLTKAFKSSTAYYQYGYPKNELINGDFNDWTSPDLLPNHWVINGSVTASTGTSVDRPDDHYLIITSSTGDVRNDTEVQVRATESVAVSFELLLEDSAVVGSFNDTVYLSILIQADNGKWFTADGWRESGAYYVIVKKGGDFQGQTNVSFEVTPQNVDYGLTFGLKALGRVNGVQWQTKFNNVKVSPSVSSNQTKPSLGVYVTQTMLSDQTYVPDPILLLHSDDDNEQRTSIIKINGSLSSRVWTRSGITELKNLLQIVADSELRQHQRPYRLFEGTFEGTGIIDINTVLTIELLAGTYIFMSGDFDLKKGAHRIKLAEVITNIIELSESDYLDWYA